jgi:hypothetical protein
LECFAADAGVSAGCSACYSEQIDSLFDMIKCPECFYFLSGSQDSRDCKNCWALERGAQISACSGGGGCQAKDDYEAITGKDQLDVLMTAKGNCLFEPIEICVMPNAQEKLGISASCSSCFAKKASCVKDI